MRPRTHLLEFVNETLLNDIYLGLDNKLVGGAIFLDLKKAFDTVDHALLCHKLAKYGVVGVSNAWFKNYLNDRRQVTRYRSKNSRPGVVTHGVPQGSILGPLLFIIYINDLPNSIFNCKVAMYADDTILYCLGESVDNVQDSLQSDLYSVERWLQANLLSLNASKTKSMLFYTSYYRGNTDLHLNIDGTELECVREFKYLGFILDSKLTFNEHINHILSKAKQRIGCLWRVRKYIKQDTALQLYKSLVLPYYDYGDVIYMHTSEQNLLKLQYMQNNACRMILRADKYESVKGMHIRLGLSALNERRLFHISGFMYKLKRGDIKSLELRFLFVDIDMYHGRLTRSLTREDLVVPSTRTTFGERAIAVFGSRIWNLLPLEFRTLGTFDTFCKHYWDRFKL